MTWSLKDGIHVEARATGTGTVPCRFLVFQATSRDPQEIQRPSGLIGVHLTFSVTVHSLEKYNYLCWAK